MYSGLEAFRTGAWKGRYSVGKEMCIPVGTSPGPCGVCTWLWSCGILLNQRAAGPGPPNVGTQGRGLLLLRGGCLKCLFLPTLSSSPQAPQNYPSLPHPCLAQHSSAGPGLAHWSARLCSAWSVADGTLSKPLNMSFPCMSTLHLLTALSEHFIARGKGKKKKGALAFIEINCESLQG